MLPGHGQRSNDRRNSGAPPPASSIQYWRSGTYRREGADRQRVMTVSADEFIRRFLLHILPRGFRRIRHYGLFAASCRKASLERIRALLAVAPSPEVTSSTVRLDSMAPPAPHS